MRHSQAAIRLKYKTSSNIKEWLKLVLSLRKKRNANFSYLLLVARAKSGNEKKNVY